MPAYVNVSGNRMTASDAMRKYKPNILQRALVSLSKIGKTQRSYGAGIAQAASSRNKKFREAGMR